MWRFAAARSKGTSHRNLNLPCQDAYRCGVLADDCFIAVVADGAGSAANAEQGADMAVDMVMTYLRRSLDETGSEFSALLKTAAELARDAISARAELEGAELRDYASTLLAVVLCPRGGAALQIGDGVIVVSEGGDDWSWVFWPQRGEYANTTFFLTDEGAIERAEVDVLTRNVTDIALMSDGLEPLALHYAHQAAHDPFFNAIFRPLHGQEGSGEVSTISILLEEFISSDTVGSRTDDDVSIILATRRNDCVSQDAAETRTN